MKCNMYFNICDFLLKDVNNSNSDSAKVENL